MKNRSLFLATTFALISFFTTTKSLCRDHETSLDTSRCTVDQNTIQKITSPCHHSNSSRGSCSHYTRYQATVYATAQDGQRITIGTLKATKSLSPFYISCQITKQDGTTIEASPGLYSQIEPLFNNMPILAFWKIMWQIE